MIAITQDTRKKKDSGKKKSIKLFVTFVKTTIMKIELIKETDEKGQVWYYVHRDGEYMSGTIHTNLEDATLQYEAICRGQKKVKEVIKQTEI